jgi:type IV secretory pathway VirD2 relaxase
MKLASGRVLDRLPAEERCLGALFTSYSFDPAFFEEHVLRAVLRLTSDPVEQAERYHHEARRALQETPVVAIVDAAERRPGRRLPFDLLEVSDVVFHPKSVLLLYREYARLLIGSGNLTFSGYGGNSELFACVDLAYDQPADVAVLLAFDEHLGRVLRLVRQQGTQINIFREELRRPLPPSPIETPPATFVLLDSTIGPIIEQLAALLPAEASITSIGMLAPSFHFCCTLPSRTSLTTSSLMQKARWAARGMVTRPSAAIRRAGGNPNRPGKTGKESGRFNARGRGAATARTLKDRSAWSQDENGLRTRARRVAVKARVVKLNPQRGGARGRQFVSARAAEAHLRYLERDGVTKDGEKGQVYSAGRDLEDGRAFLDRGREDRHQFRFIVSPEDGTDLADPRATTRALMQQMEADLGTKLDWIAVDHHNTGHPHTHILVRGITHDCKTLNIAGDYIAYGIRERASEIVTRELGRQTELEVTKQLEREVDADRFTQLDRMLIAEQRGKEFADLRPDQDMRDTFRQNRALLIQRARKLERMGLATEVETGQWIISPTAEPTLRELGERGDIIKAMHRALADHGLDEERGLGQYASHGSRLAAPVTGRILAKGLAGDEMGERIYLVVDGVDGRVHHMEFLDASRAEDVHRGMIVEAAPIVSGPRASDRNIAIVAEADGGSYRPSRHLEQVHDRLKATGKDPDAFARSHVRRLEALRRAGHVERIDADHWRVPKDLTERGMVYDLSQGGNGLSIRTLSTLDLERQIGSDGATWLDRELASRNRTPLTMAGFGSEVSDALDRRRQSLVDMGYATQLPDGRIRAPKDLVATLERAEITRVGQAMAIARGLTFRPAQAGDYVSGTLVGSTALASGRFAMIEAFSDDGGLGFSLVPWQPVLDKRIGQHITGAIRSDDSGIEWSFGRKRGLGL